MSNSKKSWNASKAKKRAMDANKKAVKIKKSEWKEGEKKANKK